MEHGKPSAAACEHRDVVGQTLQRYPATELIAKRAGPGGQQVSYMEGRTVITMANRVFGYDGWSSAITHTPEFPRVWQDESSKRWSAYALVTCRVTLAARNGGNFHEDYGTGSSLRQMSYADAAEQATKKASTDALKRSLRLFGELTGNCLGNPKYIRVVSRPQGTASFEAEEGALYHLRKRIGPPEPLSGVSRPLKWQKTEKLPSPPSEETDEYLGEFMESDVEL